MPRTKQVEKQDILQAATDVIREKGEQALTVGGIAARRVVLCKLRIDTKPGVFYNTVGN